MPIGDSISQPIPAVGTAGTTYASQIVAFLTEVKNRLEAKVGMASLLVSLLDMANNAIGNLKYVGLYEQLSAPTTPVGSLQRYQDNLYYVGASGAVRITSGTQLDASGIGGIGGDYAAPAGFWYDLANLSYLAYSDTTTTPKKWARVAAQEFDVYGSIQSTVRVRLDWAGAGSYTWTFPASLPASTKVLQISSTGEVTASNTLVDVGFSTERQRVFSPAVYLDKNGTHSFDLNVPRWQLAASTNLIVVPLTVETGEELTDFTVYATKQSDATNTLTATLYRVDSAGSSVTAVASASSNANNPGNISLSPASFSETVADNGSSYVVYLGQSDSTPSGIDFFIATTLKYRRAA